MKYFPLLVLFLVLTGSCFAQSVILDETVAVDAPKPKTGPNLRHFHHLFIGFSFAAPEAEKGAAVHYGSSNCFDFGYRYKLKVSGHYAIGSDLWAGFSNYRMRQEAGKLLPDTVLNGRETLNFSHLSASFYNRINFGRRGNHVGRFFDAGVYGQYVYNYVHYTRNKAHDGVVTEVYQKHLPYYEPLNWGLLARIGFNRFVFTGTYRMSGLFKPSYNLPDLPLLQVGMQIGLH